MNTLKAQGKKMVSSELSQNSHGSIFSTPILSRIRCMVSTKIWEIFLMDNWESYFLFLQHPYKFTSRIVFKIQFYLLLFYSHTRYKYFILRLFFFFFFLRKYIRKAYFKRHPLWKSRDKGELEGFHYYSGINRGKEY